MGLFDAGRRRLLDSLLEEEAVLQQGGTVRVRLHTADPGRDYEIGEVLAEGDLPGMSGATYRLYQVPPDQARRRSSHNPWPADGPLANYRIDRDGRVWRNVAGDWRLTNLAPDGAPKTPAAEPFPPGPLRWTATRLDKELPCADRP